MTRNILLLSSGLVHPSLLLRRRIRRLLSETIPGGGDRPEPRLDVTSRLSRLAGLDPDRTAAVVLLYHRKKLPPGALDGLSSFVRRGGGVLALHAALASFKDHPGYAELLGSPFGGHDAPGLIRVLPAVSRSTAGGTAGAPESAPAPESPIPREGVVVRDELYRVSLCADATVLAEGHLGSGEVQPVCWERSVGEGRVAVVTLGHYARTYRVSFLRRLIQDELRRLSGRPAA